VKQTMSTLISDIVDPFTLKRLDPFDLSFLAATGHLAEGDAIDAAFVLLKHVMKDARDIELWGPEAKLLDSALSTHWRHSSEQMMADLKAAFKYEPENVSVNEKDVASAFKSFKKKWMDGLDEAVTKANVIIEQTILRSVTHHEATARKADYPTPSSQEWDLFTQMVIEADQIRRFLLKFPDRIIQPEIERLVNLAKENPHMRSVDIGVLGQKLDNLTKFGQEYLNTLSDVQVGRVWTWTGMEWGHRNGFNVYMVLAEMDGNTCDVCGMIHGKEFAVEDARNKLTDAGTETDVTKIKDFLPFPRHAELDNKSPAQWKSMALVPPFHGRCRCQVVLTGVGSEAVRVKAPTAAPDKIPKKVEDAIKAYTARGGSLASKFPYSAKKKEVLEKWVANGTYDGEAPVFRGMGFTEKQWDKVWEQYTTKGSTITLEQLTSFSKDRIRTSAYGEGEVHVRMTIKGKVAGRDISRWSVYPEEMEVLIPKDTMLEVVSAEWSKPGFVEMVVREAPKV